MKSIRLQTTGRKGFSLLELLIAVIIMGILVSLVVFAFVRRSEEARISQALNDVDLIAEAEQQACVDTGYYCQLFLLDNAATTDTVTQWAPEGLALNKVFVDPKTDQMVPDSTIAWQRVRPLTSNPNRWRGPYSDFKGRLLWDFTGYGDMFGTPIDPWGNPYEFFTTYGWVSPLNGSVGQQVAPYWKTSGAASLKFDKCTIISPGPDGIIGTTDDIMRQF